MKPKRRGIGMLITGLVLMLLVAPLLFGIGAWYGVKHIKDVADSAQTVTQGGTLALDANEKALVMVDVGSGSGSSFNVETGTATQACDVTGPDGGALVATDTDKITATLNGRRYESAGVFQATGAGDYTINCSGGPTKVITGDKVEGMIGGTFLPVALGFGAATLAGIIGLILTIVGIVKMVRSGRERNQVGGPPPAYGTGYGQQPPPYGQQPSYGQTPPGLSNDGRAPQSYSPGGSSAAPPPPAGGQNYPPPPSTTSGSGYPPPPPPPPAGSGS